MRFEVPQFIEIEDKIFGPLTWRQLLYLGGGIGMAVVLFLTASFLVFALVGVPIAALGMALAFFQVNSRPFSYFLESLFNYSRAQRLYLWKKKGDAVYKYTEEEAVEDPAYATPSSTGPRRAQKNISSLARKLELQALQKPE